MSDTKLLHVHTGKHAGGKHRAPKNQKKIRRARHATRVSRRANRG